MGLVGVEGDTGSGGELVGDVGEGQHVVVVPGDNLVEACDGEDVSESGASRGLGQDTQAVHQVDEDLVGTSLPVSVGVESAPAISLLADERIESSGAENADGGAGPLAAEADA